ncbi:uncharacterized protein [Amphiura filiformis]|uniref:uncharacterized protein n=1 Tax=Amphiura filiformis TaxID=82378 RepID=UPI003B215486
MLRINTVVDQQLEQLKGAEINKFRCAMHPLDSFQKSSNKVLGENEAIDSKKPALPDSKHCKADPFKQLLLFLMKLRLNLATQDLAYRFHLSTSAVSRIFHHVLDVMAPSDLLARAQTWSQYKHHHTLTFLVGITPQGTISFLSQCWGGRASDKEITENSGFLNFLEAGDVIIADRGFTIDEYCRLAMCEVKLPPFTRGKKQLVKVDVDWSRELSIVRIHVERVIGTVKQKYTLLRGTLPISLVGNGYATMGKIVRVCGALYNLCPSVVPLN